MHSTAHQATARQKARRGGSGLRPSIFLVGLLVLPALILAVVFKLVPLVRAFWLSLLKTQGF